MQQLECYQFVQNESNCPQVLFTGGMDPLKLEPGEVRDVSRAAKIPGSFKRIQSIISYLLETGTKQLTLSRSYATGDILMLVPVIRYLEKNYGLEVFIKSSDERTEVLSLLGVKVVTQPVGVTVCLDGVVEYDHWIPECQKYHRVELYLKALGIYDRIDSADLDWTCDLSRFGYSVLDGDYIVFQGMGSRASKSLPSKTINEMLQLLSQKCKVAYVGSEKGIDKLSNVFYFGYNGSLVQLFNLIGLAKCVICMDSMPLWISHFVKTPTIVLLGPTPAKNRISFHPLYEEGTVAVQLNERLDCECCFERAQECNRKVSCLDISGKELFGMIAKDVERFAGN